MTSYPVRYKIEIGQFDPEELKCTGEWGGCDALVLTSIVRDHKPPHSGSISFMTLTLDGVGVTDLWTSKEIPVTELFEVWLHLAKAISDNPEAPGWQRQVAGQIFDQVRQRILP